MTGWHTTGRNLGVDACRSGWVGRASDGAFFHASTIEGLVREAESDGRVGVVAIDIPIGLAADAWRMCDLEAKKFVGPRRSSVFLTPVRAALEADNYAEATAISLSITGSGISRQAYALRPKIMEVEEWVESTALSVIEVHPEVSFSTIAGCHLRWPKKVWSGVEERLRLLEGAGLRPGAAIGAAGDRAGVDDILDASAASWTADRYARGDAISHPAPPEIVTRRASAAIWA